MSGIALKLISDQLWRRSCYIRIIQVRIAAKIDQEVSIVQSGFRPKMGTTEGTFNLRTVCERALEVGREVHICFIHHTKAFKGVRHSKMEECLQKIGIDEKDLKMITKMYWEQSAVVRTEFGTTTEFQIKIKGCETRLCSVIQFIQSVH